MNESEHTRKVYNEIAEAYHIKRQDPESAAWNDYLEVPAMKALLQPIVGGKRVLDLGCGTGLLTREVVKWGGQARGVDLSQEMINIARSDNIDMDFTVAGADNLPFDDNEFDVVASSLVMHYMKDLTPAFREVARVLDDNGQFVFSMHHPMQESFTTDKSRADGRPVLHPYFNNDHYYWRMCGVELLSFHHTFEDIVRSLRDSGFALRDLIECRPGGESRNVFEDFEFTSNYPTFCVFHASRYWPGFAG